MGINNIAKSTSVHTFRTGDPVNWNGVNGIVEDGHMRKSGPKQGKINVLFIGGRDGYVTAYPINLTPGWVTPEDEAPVKACTECGSTSLETL